eukprot:gene6163-6791_t
MTDLVQYIGLDFGGQKTIVVAEDAEIIRTTTGSVARPSLLSFSNGRRVFGDEASAQITAEYTLPLLSMMIGRTLEEVRAQPWYSQLRVPVQADSEGRLFLTINHDIELEQQQSETETTVVDESNRFYVTSLVAMYLAQIVNQIQSEQKAKPDDTAPTAAVGEEGTTNTTTPNSTLRYVLTAFTPNASIYNNWIQACRIAGLEEKQVVLVDPTQSLVAAYARKIAGLGGPEAAGVMGKNVLLVDVGHCQTSVVLVTYEPPAAVPEGGNSDAMVLPKVLNKAYSDAFGAYFYDLLLFNHFQTMIQEKYKTTVEPGTRKSLRLLLACERVRKLLSQLPEGIVTVENICENADINLRITREEFASCCQSLNTLFQEMINDCKKGEESVGLDYVIDSVEVSGGGCRMPHIQNLLLNLLANNNQGTGNAILGAKLDDSSNALGGVLCVKNYNQFTAPVEYDVLKSDSSKLLWFTENEVEKMQQFEIILQTHENKLDQIHHLYNQIEVKLLEMKNVYKTSSNNNDEINKESLYKTIQDYEHLLYDVMENNEEYHLQHPSSQQLQQEVQEDHIVHQGVLDRKLHSLQRLLEDCSLAARTLCASYYDALEKRKTALEEELTAAAAAAAEEEGDNDGDENGNGGEDRTVSRKLKKSDRLRLIQKNKEEGNELFKDGNYKLAVIRYQKSIGHINMLYETSSLLTEEEKKEMETTQISLYNNIALAYFKVEKWELVLTHVEKVLALDKKNKKALYRRGSYYEIHKKDMEKAYADYKACADLIPAGQALTEMNNEDKLIMKAMERMKKEMTKLKEKEKKMWGKAFA